ncbi:MAG: SDR family oxidoreductase, partial [Planctomycetota bacterium]
YPVGMAQEWSLAGKTAAVIGASSGIGKAIALRLAASGADLFLHGNRNRVGLADTVRGATELNRLTADTLLDLSDPAAAEQLVERAWDWRPIDVWVHAAGADVLTGAAAGLPFADKLDMLWRVDVRAAMLACRDAAERMKPRGGVVLTIGWDQAAWGMEGEAGEMFAATKGAVMAFTRSLAKSAAPSVRVNCVAPGWIRTKWGDDAPAAWQERAVGESLVGRWGDPADVAAAAAYLASPDASFVTGQVININGGFRSAAADPS